jgi:hypothetical protein
MPLHTTIQTAFLAAAGILAVGALAEVVRVLRNSNKDMHAARAASKSRKSTGFPQISADCAEE